MKRQLFNDWIALLRSNKYEQGDVYLRDEQERYCCLGLLCVVEGHSWELDDWGYYRNEDDEHETFAAPEDHGLTPDQHYVCYMMNDGGMNEADLAKYDLTRDGPYTFPEIADWLEAHLTPEDDQ